MVLSFMILGLGSDSGVWDRVHVKGPIHSVIFYQELDVFGAVPVRKKDEVLD